MEIHINLCLCLLENIPVRNSDVDYRLLEAAKAGDLDTVKVRGAFIWFQTSCLPVNQGLNKICGDLVEPRYNMKLFALSRNLGQYFSFL